MDRAKLRALEAYPIAIDIYSDNCKEYDFNESKRIVYAEGYEQCQKDFIEKACKFLDDRIGIGQKIEVDENGEPLADSYIAYCVARKQESARIIKLFKQYMERE